MREKRTITKEEKAYLLSIKQEDITLKLLQELFADHYDAVKKKVIPSKFNTYDELSLAKGEWCGVNEEIKVTNCGLLVLNTFLYSKSLYKEVGYINKPYSDDTIGEIYSILDPALLEDRITTEEYVEFLNNLSWIAFSFNTEVSTSLTIHSMKPLPEVEKAKAKMLKDNAKAFEKGNIDIVTVTKIEKDLVDIAKDAMKTDTAYDMYESGARGSFKVAYKNGQIMKGPVFNSSTGKWEVVTNGLATGIDKDDIAVLANSTVDSAYSKAIAPGECGYLSKKLSAAFQSVTLDKKGSDCGTKMFTEMVMTKDLYKYYKYCYMIEGSKLVRLDPSNYTKYLGKKVKMRTNNYCIGKTTCNKCAGDLFYLLGIDAIGLTAARASNSMQQARMKVFHDSTVSTYEISVDDFL